MFISAAGRWRELIAVQKEMGAGEIAPVTDIALANGQLQFSAIRICEASKAWEHSESIDDEGDTGSLPMQFGASNWLGASMFKVCLS